LRSTADADECSHFFFLFFSCFLFPSWCCVAGPEKLTLQVSTEFFREWHEEQYRDLLDGGYVPGMTGGFDGRFRDHQVLCMTTGICFTRPELTQGRTVVILDESSQIWSVRHPTRIGHGESGAH